MEVSIETLDDSTFLPAATGWCNKLDYQEAVCDEPDSMSARPFPKSTGQGITGFESHTHLGYGLQPSLPLEGSARDFQEAHVPEHPTYDCSTGVDERNEEESIPPILDQPASRSITLQPLEITPPESPPLYSLPSSIAHSQWHDDEIHYLKNLMERNLTWRQRYNKVVRRFGGCRTYTSLLAASRKLYSDCPNFSKRKSDKRWTVTDTEYLLHLIANEVDWADVAEKFQT